MHTMRWFSFFRRNPERQAVARLASEIAQRSFDAVCRRLSSAAWGMRLYEARGYVRVRAAAVIEAEACRAGGAMTADERAELVRRASEIVVAAAVEHLHRGQPPAARRAA
jgi:hypothetical protein